MNSSEVRKVLKQCLDPDRWACKIRYESECGETTDRFISPIRISGDGTMVNALCLGRQEPRNFVIGRITHIRAVAASDVIAPAEIKVISRKPPTHVMVDLETLAQSSDAVIVSVGAVKFDSDGLGESFYRVVDRQSCLDVGLVVDAATLDWWMKQSVEARAVFDEPGSPLTVVLDEFGKWLGPGAVVWGNGAAFDNAIMAHAHRVTSRPPAWSHRNDRCYRTIRKICPDVCLEHQGVKHNALDDAKSQATHLIACFVSLGLCVDSNEKSEE